MNCEHEYKYSDGKIENNMVYQEFTCNLCFNKKVLSSPKREKPNIPTFFTEAELNKLQKAMNKI